MSSNISTPRFEEGNALVFAGLQKHYTRESARTIPALWQEFAPHIGKVPGQVGEFSYGLNTVAAPGSPEFPYTAAVEVSSPDNPLPGFVTIHVPAYRYAVFTHEGHVSEIAQAVSLAMNEWLPASGVKPAAAQPGDLVFYERYDRNFNPQTGRGGIEIWFPLQP